VLASSPRAGSTWLRFMIERATGRPSGVDCPGYGRVLERGPSGVVVKSHGACGNCAAARAGAACRSTSGASPAYAAAWAGADLGALAARRDAAVVLVRNPYDQIRSAFYHFTEVYRSSRTWNEAFVRSQALGLRTFLLSWICCVRVAPPRPGPRTRANRGVRREMESAARDAEARRGPRRLRRQRVDRRRAARHRARVQPR